MAKEEKIPLPSLTTRAYTLRLRGSAGGNTWRDNLWRTHEAVNKGAKVFGDWLLTLRGGLCHKLADEPPVSDGDIGKELKELEKTAKREKKTEPTRGDAKKSAEEKRSGRIRDRRIVLALSWLSVESEKDAPPKESGLIAATGRDEKEEREKKVLDALRDILKTRASANPKAQIDIDGWIANCRGSLSAAVREDAVWVNRGKAFDAACNGQNKEQAREDAQTLLWYLLTDDYLVLPKRSEKRQSEVEDQGGEESDADAAVEAVAKSGKGAGQRTRHPFSHIFGRGNTQGFGKPVRTLNLLDHWRKYIKPLVEAAGIPLRDPNIKTKKGAPPSQTELHREMFSKAASRLAQIWTKQKQQEVARKQRAAADEDLKQMERDTSYRNALNLLNDYCIERGRATGASEEYYIRPRTAEGWERVVPSWSRISEQDETKATEERIEAVKRLPEEDREKKFGDINLFIKLAEHKYKPVWQHDGHTTAAILNAYVKGGKARADAVRLKVAAYRHPDPYFNPVFCQFGVSRPGIEFRRLQNFTTKPEGRDVRAIGLLLWDGQKADTHVLHAVSKRLDREIGAACDQAHKGASDLVDVTRRSRLGVAAITQPLEQNKVRVAHVFDRKKVKSRGSKETETEKKPTWNGSLLGDRQALEHIGRLLKEGKDAEAEKRRKRLHWWLSVSLELRPQGPWYDYVKNSLDKSAFLRTIRADEEKGQKRRMGTKYISLSGWPHDEINKPLKENKIGTKLVIDSKLERKGMAKHLLSRLPGLRVISADLGHRYAAACAVWETLTKDNFEKEYRDAKAKKANVVFGPGGCKADDALYARFIWPEKKDEKGRGFNPVTVYRRIGADCIEVVDKKTGEIKTVTHPAPWARLERQFLIKLQGEDTDARWATDFERSRVKQWENEFEYLRRNDPETGGVRVDKLMWDTVSLFRAALRRHGDRARIAFAMTTDYKLMSGDRKYYFNEEKDASSQDDTKKRRAKHIECIQDALALWHELSVNTRWDDPEARPRWNECIQPLLASAHFTEPPLLTEGENKDKDKRKRHENLIEQWRNVWAELQKPIPQPEKMKDEGESEDRKAHRLQADAVHALLRPVAERLLDDKQTRNDLHKFWGEYWSNEDGDPAKVDKFSGKPDIGGTGWHVRLNQLRKWILGHDKKTNIHRTGGLSLTRVSVFKELYQLQKAFYTRFKPEGRQMKRDKNDQLTDVPLTADENFGKSILAALEEIRTNRSKQLASRIAEAALGIGTENRQHWQDGTKRPRQRLHWVDNAGTEHGDRRFAPCHTVVIEYLKDYKPDEIRGKRENQQLAAWRVAMVQKYLSESCELHGLHLRAVPAKYTSQQDSRTGAPGKRCQDVAVTDFVRQGGYVWKRIKKAIEEVTETKDNASAENLLLVNVYRCWDETEKTWTDGNGHKWTLGQDGRWSQKDGVTLDQKKHESPAMVRIPQRGGGIFVSADANSPSAKGLQADLNAAANIGLKALLDPDWEGRWWYIPCNSNTFTPVADNVKGCAVIDISESLRSVVDSESSTRAGKRNSGQKKDVVNLWRDVSTCPISAKYGNWRSHPEYWNGVEARVITILRERAGLKGGKL